MMDATYATLGSKANFNKALRHFFKVTESVDEVDGSNNLADVLNEWLESEEIVMGQVLPIIGAVLRDKYGYTYDSFDIPVKAQDFKRIADETLKWTAMDLVLVYSNPNGQISLINPKSEESWSRVRELMSDHLLVIYAKFLKEEKGNSKIELEAIRAIEEMLSGKDVFINKEFIDEKVAPRQTQRKQEPAPRPAAAGTAAPAAAPAQRGTRRATPMYSVQVTNELFHNGNVEAWKKIIESYKTTFPDLEVVVYYENEVINDLNTLFQWGKVKHGGVILFQVVGENIRGVSKLQKYLFEGASHRFEQFLKAGVGKVLNLF